MDEATIKALDELNEVIRIVVDIAKKLFSGRIKFVCWDQAAGGAWQNAPKCLKIRQKRIDRY